MRLFKRISSVVLASGLLMGLASGVSAQELKTHDDFLNRYNLVASRVGPEGVGVETLLDKWEAAFPNDIEMCMARFSFYYERCRTVTTINRPTNKYLGKEPIVALKDSLGNPVNYFEDYVYDDELFGKATSYVDKAISVDQNRLELRLLKAAALIEYEKESPDMTLSFLKGLADYNAQAKPKWTYPDYDTVTNDDFVGFIQEYCHMLYQTGTPSGWEAFKSLSEKMLQYNPKNPLFLTNLGSYYFAYKKDNKSALKYYNQVLKIQPDSYPAIKNCVLLARAANDKKLQKKYLPMLVKYGQTETEKLQAQTMLDSLK